ncbi:MAG: phosphodiester glycosidase family protein [Bacteroidales bacterium]|nr:phosphodiester glycosidase family protein [Bacteroidales bacterium]
MKKKVYNMLAFLMAAGLALMSCGQTEDELPEASLTVTPAVVQLDPQGGQEYLTVSSDEDWLMRSDVNWVKVVTSSGKASVDLVKASFTYDANTTGSVREGRLTVKSLSGKTVDVQLSQGKLDGPVAQRGISSPEDLIAFAQAVNEGSSLTPFMVDGVVVLLNDIDASSISEWIPIGTAANPFSGNFDGGGNLISNINWTIDASKYADAGIFGCIKGASIIGLNVGAAGNRITVKGNASALNAGVIAGNASGGSLTGCINYADLVYEGNASGGSVCLAGICGRSSSNIASCTNKGNILSPVVCRAAGFVAYNEGKVEGCINYGCILAEKSGEIGPSWACSYQKTPANFIKNTGNGHVGSYAAYKDNPAGADSDAYLNAVVSPAKEGYDMDEAKIDNTKESYLNWKEVTSRQVASGVRYSHYDCINTPLKIHILEIDLSNPAVEVTTSYANDCVPNPNGNGNSNNGFNIRETLSQLCNRKRSEGNNIVAGVNTGFFDSNDGISRGFHIEEGEPVYINNPDVVKRLSNHAWGITIFTDGTASCGKKGFNGRLRTAGQEFEWCSMNDTIMRNVSSAYNINLYDSHYKQYPHPAHTNLTNKLAKNALYVIAEYVDAPMTVNNGYAAAKIVSIADGRTGTLANPPYITSERQVGISLSGAKADVFASLVKVGSTVEFRCDMTIEGEKTRPIYTQNSSMYHLLKDGVNNLGSVGSSDLPTKRDPHMFPVISKDKKTLWLVEADGRQGWYSTGINGTEMLVLAKKLGGYNMTNVDGGGSATMWVYDSVAGSGKVVNSVSDSKGERSCLNYMLVKIK